MSRWLKAAYLSVFSLLGMHGYKYAEGVAVESVRQQIMKPKDKIIPRFIADATAWAVPDGIIVSGKTPGWAVKMGKRIVLLPRGWDQEFYARIGDTPGGEITLGDGPLWFPARFGFRSPRWNDHVPRRVQTSRVARRECFRCSRPSSQGR